MLATARSDGIFRVLSLRERRSSPRRALAIDAGVGKKQNI